MAGHMHREDIQTHSIATSYVDKGIFITGLNGRPYITISRHSSTTGQ